MIKKFFTIFLLINALGVMSCSEAKAVSLGEKAMEKKIAGLNDGLYAVIATTKGNIYLELFYDQTPVTVANFVGLAEGNLKNSAKEGAYFDGLTFHRVEKGFVIQGGDPQGDGTGGPGYQFPNEIVSGLKFDKEGMLAMANAGPHTNGSQFFITLSATPHLNGSYTIFGKTVDAESMSVVRSITVGDKMNTVTIFRKGAQAEAFTADQALFDSELEALKAKVRAENDVKNEKNIALMQKVLPEAKQSPAGVYYTITKSGSGEKPQKGDTVVVHYEGKFLETNEVFDSSYSRNEPLKFPAGVGKVIPGWDEMMLDMAKGEERLMVIPSDLAYGDRGYGPIPPKAWLIFKVEMLDIIK